MPAWLSLHILRHAGKPSIRCRPVNSALGRTTADLVITMPQSTFHPVKVSAIGLGIGLVGGVAAFLLDPPPRSLALAVCFVTVAIGLAIVLYGFSAAWKQWIVEYKRPPE